MYSDLIVENFTNPTRSGGLESPDFVIEVGNSVCGDRVKVDITANDVEITEAKFQAWGCATSVAAANIFCNAISGLSLGKLLTFAEKDIEQLLGELSPDQKHCIDLMLELFGQAKTVSRRLA